LISAAVSDDADRCSVIGTKSKPMPLDFSTSSDATSSIGRVEVIA
jgi:hypothetical protein